MMDTRKRFADLAEVEPFGTKIKDTSIAMTADMNVLQINVGRLCNLACKHCHVEAGPQRTEIMSRDVMEACLRAYVSQGFNTIDITGGAPEMNPDFRWLVEEACKICGHVIVRTNLVIMLMNKKDDFRNRSRKGAFLLTNELEKPNIYRKRDEHHRLNENK